MTDSPSDSAPEPAAPDPASAADLLGGGDPAPAQSYTDPVEEQGARFAREADDGDPDGQETQRPATGGDPSGGDLSPDFLAPTQPS